MTGRSTCPECSTILRIRDQSFIGRRVNCPECNTVLKVEQPDREGNFAVRRLSPDEANAARKKRKVPTEGQIAVDQPTKSSSVQKILNSKVTVACLLLVGIISLVAVVSMKSQSRPLATRGTKSSSVAVTPDPAPPVETPTGTPDRVDVPPSPSDSAVVAQVEKPIQLTEVEDVQPLSAIAPENYDQPYPWEAEPVAAAMVPPAPVKIDVEGKLSLKIVSYKQPKVARQELLDALEEQLGAPIRYDKDDLGKDGLEEKISFDLQNTTIGGVIQQVAQTAGWQVQIEDTGVRLLRSPSNSTP